MPMPRPQVTLRALLVAMLVVAAFFGGIRWEREQQRRATWSTARAGPTVQIAVIDANPDDIDRVTSLFDDHGIQSFIEGSVVYGVSVPSDKKLRAISLLRADAAAGRYWIQFSE